MTAIAFRTKLKSGTVHLPEVDNLIGKEVIITVVEINTERPIGKRNWNFLGASDFHKELDNINIRDFAHE